MIENMSFEPAIEEEVTWAVQRRFMTDGRLRVTNRRDADIVVQVRVTDFQRHTPSREVDEFPQSTEVSILSEVYVYEKGAEEAFGQFPDIHANFSYITDQRRSFRKSEPEWKRDLFIFFANEVVKTVISGPYGESEIIEPRDATVPPLPGQPKQRTGIGVNI